MRSLLAILLLGGCVDQPAAVAPRESAITVGSANILYLRPSLTDHGGPRLLAPSVTPIMWSAADTTDWEPFYNVTAASHVARLTEYGITGITSGAQVNLPVGSAKKYDFSVDDANCKSTQRLARSVCKLERELTDLFESSTSLAAPPPTQNTYYAIQLGGDDVPPESWFGNCDGGYHTVFVSSVYGSGAVVNGDFSSAISGWALSGHAAIDTNDNQAIICAAITGGCTGSLSQEITVPNVAAPGMMFWLRTIVTAGDTQLAVTVQPTGSTGTAPIQFAVSQFYAVENGGDSGWQRYVVPFYNESVNLAGQAVTVNFSGATTFGGNTSLYVSDVTTGAVAVYGVMNPCNHGSPPDPTNPNYAVDQGTASHELIESATDPLGGDCGDARGLPTVAGVAGLWDDNNRVGNSVGGTGFEAGDLCEGSPSYTVTVGANSYTTATCWSNSALSCIGDPTYVMPPATLPSGSFEPPIAPPDMGWSTSSPSDIDTAGYHPHAGVGDVVLGGAGSTDSVTSPTFYVPTAPKRDPGLWLYAYTLPGGTGNSKLTISLYQTKLAKTTRVGTFGPTDNTYGYVGYWIDMGGFRGGYVQLIFAVANDPTNTTQYLIDDVSLQ